MVPETPSHTDFLPPQFGYKDVQVKTHQYNDAPTPFAAQEGKASEFFHSQTDKEHQKKYAKKLFDILIRQVCN